MEDRPASLSRPEQELRHNAIIRTYPCGAVDILCSSGQPFGLSGWESDDGEAVSGRAARAPGVKSSGEDQLRSMRRARSKVRQIALANDFRWFVTLTLDPQKIDRYDERSVTRALCAWCSNMVQRHALRYVLVPERHKDGAFHFHGFFSDSCEAVESGQYTKRGQPIYNLPDWKYGFTAAIPVYGEYTAAVAYCCKYIGKQQGERALGRWYFSGGKLRKPDEQLADLDYRELQQRFGAAAFEVELPGSQMLIIRQKPEKTTEKE